MQDWSHETAEDGAPVADPVEHGTRFDDTKTQASGDYSMTAYAYANARAQRFRRTAAMEKAPRPRLAIAVVVVISFLANVAVALTQVLPSSPETAIVLGVILVVLLGAGGLASRGVGELRNSPGWKAAGCFLCAAAYVGTATVALVNGVPLILEA